MQPTPSTRLFTRKAEQVSAIVTQVATLSDALDYARRACEQKEACPLLVSGCEAELSPSGRTLCDQKQAKLIAAPGLNEAVRGDFAKACAGAGIEVVYDGLRNHLAGVDIGITLADWGIAETGTLVIDSSDEEVRLASMISEIHVALLPVKRIVGSVDEIAVALEAKMSATGNYTAFITGASRTADIERVLALGVHGPLELHILLLGEG